MTKLDEVALAIGRIRLALTDAQHDLMDEVDRLREESARLVAERDGANALFDARVPMGREDFTGKPLVERVRLLFSIRDSVGKLAGSLAEQIAPETLTALEQAEVDRDRLRRLLDDAGLYLRTCEQKLIPHPRTPWWDGLNNMICAIELALSETRAAHRGDAMSESPRCPHCGTVMCQRFDADVRWCRPADGEVAGS